MEMNILRDVKEFVQVALIFLLLYGAAYIMAVGYHQLTGVAFRYPSVTALALLYALTLFFGTVEGWLDRKKDYGWGLTMLTVIVLGPVLLNQLSRFAAVPEVVEWATWLKFRLPAAGLTLLAGVCLVTWLQAKEEAWYTKYGSQDDTDTPRYAA